MALLAKRVNASATSSTWTSVSWAPVDFARRRTVRIDFSGDLAFLDSQVTGAPDGPGTLFGVESGGLFDEPFHGMITLSSGHPEEARILWLAARKRERSFDRGADRVFINAICGSARGSAVNDRANRNRQAMLGDV